MRPAVICKMFELCKHKTQPQTNSVPLKLQYIGCHLLDYTQGGLKEFIQRFTNQKTILDILFEFTDCVIKNHSHLHLEIKSKQK